MIYEIFLFFILAQKRAKFQKDGHHPWDIPKYHTEYEKDAIMFMSSDLERTHGQTEPILRFHFVKK